MPAQSPSPSSSDTEEGFYARLPLLADLKRLNEAEQFTAVPLSWCVVVADVVNSTEAIDAGRYKDVNVVGALSIVAMLNMATDCGVDVPFTFGGDGALMLVPSSLRLDAEDVLIDVRRRARRDFGLELRAGIIPVGDLYARGETLTVARWQAAPHYVQALFLGGGMARAERLVKDTASRYRIEREDGVFEADYTGFSCRWREIPSPHAESVCLLVQAGAGENASATYQALLAKIESVYGDERRRHPITEGGLRPSLRNADLEAEARVAVPGTGDAAATQKALRKRVGKLRSEVLFTNLWTMLKTRTSARRTRQWFPRMEEAAANAPGAEPMNWGKYKQYLIETSDIQKLDGALRLVMSGYAAQRERLTEFLEDEFRAGHLAYGLHVSTGALMTCLVYQPNGRQVHFVDGADGGYALAARALKGRVLALEHAATASP